MSSIHQEILLVRNNEARRDQEIARLTQEVRRLTNLVEKQNQRLEELESGTLIPTLKRGIKNACETGDWSKCAQILEQNEAEGSAIFKQLKNAKTSKNLPLTAAKDGYIELIQVLLKNGLNVNQSFENMTMLHASSKWGQSIVADFLLLQNANIQTRDADGWTPLHYASFNGHADVVALLLDRGADVNVTDNDGNSLLHAAAFNGHFIVVKCLLDNNCDKHRINNDGKKVLDVALEKRHNEIVKLLFEK